jgi:hypothetical protein
MTRFDRCGVIDRWARASPIPTLLDRHYRCRVGRVSTAAMRDVWLMHSVRRLRFVREPANGGLFASAQVIS